MLFPRIEIRLLDEGAYVRVLKEFKAEKDGPLLDEKTTVDQFCKDNFAALGDKQTIHPANANGDIVIQKVKA